MEATFSGSAYFDVSFIIVDGGTVIFSLAEDCGVPELDISDHEKSYAFNDRVLENVLILNPCQRILNPSHIPSDIEVIIYSKEVGIVLIKFLDGRYLFNKEVNDL